MKKLIYFLSILLALLFLYNGNAQSQTKKHHKKHWTHRKKDAVIGGATGAVVGAAVSKHHVKGAVIGGAAGAGTGYLIGKGKDKKHSGK